MNGEWKEDKRWFKDVNGERRDEWRSKQGPYLTLI